VDPYFASKAILESKRLGLDVERASAAWIRWMIAHQLPDGRFERYCSGSSVAPLWTVCAEADADDATMAIWIQLLLSVAPAEGMPRAWRTSLASAAGFLRRLRDERLGVYQISSTQPVALLMDNIEVYAALRMLAAAPRVLSARHAGKSSSVTRLAPEQLRDAIMDVFWDPVARRFRVSTQVLNMGGFYPDEVAQLYPLLDDLPVDRPSAAAYRDWMRRNDSTWLDMRADHYPWGLVALAAFKMGDDARVRCWLAKAAPFRYGPRWNVLEEAIFQALNAANERVKPTEPCSAIER
ncbi:MAG TPA: hypothetical protein VGP93_19720, partial [Polyangiaceae bacterium]|nr:hypothetical protein [Polyangiaceae bacterium]